MGFKFAIFTLNQWALDFVGNTRRILDSIHSACIEGAVYRAGPELELCGYSLEDAFYEQDTVFHCWKCLLDILEQTKNMKIIIDIGMPVFNCALYNCRVICYNGKILCIRAKTSLAREGIYREYRHFTPWNIKHGLTSFKLPTFVSRKLKQDFVPFGANFILEIPLTNTTVDTLKIGWEICQELWDVKNVSSTLYQDFGCHLIFNGSASYWELRKLDTVTDMIKGISLRGGACYAFSNLIGCDGQRFVFYGRSCIYDKGQLIAMTSRFHERIFEDVQMILHTIFPRDIEEYRAQMGIFINRIPGSTLDLNEMIEKNSCNINPNCNRLYLKTLENLPNTEQNFLGSIKEIPTRFEQEIQQYVTLWLWDYLRRSMMNGFMLPLSGGLDSCSVAVLVYGLCRYLYSIKDVGNQVKDYFRIVHKIDAIKFGEQIKSPEEMCKKILKCSYLSTKYSGQETFNRAKKLANSIGAEFVSINFQDVYSKFRDLLNPNCNDEVTVLDQNLQARMRMTATYYLSGGNRIVLATGNVDEAIMGYLTKYDCSSADINPIGGLCKNDLKSYLIYCSRELYKTDKKDLIQVLEDIIAAPPSAELTGAEQRDEVEIGITYNEIALLGKVRRGIYSCGGPRGVFDYIWRNRHVKPFCDTLRCLNDTQDLNDYLRARELSILIRLFFARYAKHRHKLTVLTPALHAETYSPDDNRFDHRHFLFAPWTEQFEAMDTMVDAIRAENSIDKRLKN